MKPCPNPVCKTPQPRIEAQNIVTFYVVCRHCGMRGPKSVEENNAIRLWEMLPRQSEIESWVTEMLEEEQAAMHHAAQQGVAAELLPPVAKDVDVDAWVKGTQIP